MNFYTRIKELLAALGITQKEFAERIGVSEQGIIKWQKGTMPNKATQRVIEQTFHVNPEWLRGSGGEMFKTPGEYDIFAENDTDTKLWFYNTVKVSAGYGTEFMEETKEKFNFTRHVLDKLKQHGGNISIVQVDGNSMEPQFRHGDLLFVDTSQNLLCREGVYVLRINYSVVVKYVQVEPGGVRLLSRNPQYRDIVLTGDEASDNGGVVIVGRVLGAVTFNY